jgi:hypothetical protein
MVEEDSGLLGLEEQEGDVEIALKLFLVKYFVVVLTYPKTCLQSVVGRLLLVLKHQTVIPRIRPKRCD